MSEITQKIINDLETAQKLLKDIRKYIQILENDQNEVTQEQFNEMSWEEKDALRKKNSELHDKLLIRKLRNKKIGD